MTTIRVTVAPGCRVRMPDGKLLEEKVEHDLEPSVFVTRRIRSGDLVPVPAKKGK
jgi:hypothetical protein